MIQPIGEYVGPQRFVEHSLPNFVTGGAPRRMYGNQVLKTELGRVEDPELLDTITR